MLLIEGQVIRVRRSVSLGKRAPLPHLNRTQELQAKGKEHQTGNIIRVLNSLIQFVEKYHTF